MKLSIALVVCICALIMAAVPKKVYYDLEKAPELFEQFIKDYNRHYKDNADKQVHFEAFKKSLESSNRLNKNSDTATYGINEYSDYTPDEEKNMIGFIPSK